MSSLDDERETSLFGKLNMPKMIAFESLKVHTFLFIFYFESLTLK